jgi:hypothetical protein
MNRSHLALFAASLMVGCSGGSDDNGGDLDAGSDSSSHADARSDGASNNGDAAALDASDGGATDAIADDGSDDAPDIDSGSPIGTRIQSGAARLRGVTRDDFAVYSNAAGDVFAAPVAGGSAVKITTIVEPAQVTIAGKAVFVWPTFNPSNFVGALTVWTAASGAKTLTTTSLVDQAAASADGAYVIYSANLNGSGTFGDLVLSKSDGTGAVTLVSGNDFDSCTPILGFAGGYAVATHCETAAPDGSTPPKTLSSYLLPAGTKTDLLNDVGFFWNADDSGSKIFTATAAGDGKVVPVTGGAATAIDTSVASGLISGDGTTVFYRTSASALKRSPVASAAPIALQSTGVAIVRGISSGEGFLMFASKRDSSTDLTDLFLASLVTPGPAVPLVTTTTGAVYGDRFTSDATRALYYSAVDDVSQIGTLQALPVAGGNATTLGQAVWRNRASTGAKVVFNDNFTPLGDTPGRADLRVVDLAQSAAPTLLAPQADVEFALAASRTKVVYTWNVTTAKGGLYVAPVP